MRYLKHISSQTGTSPEDYKFCLNWSDLPEELQEEKISTFILRLRQGGEFPDDESLTLTQLVKKYYDEVERDIKAHFPAYF